MDTNAYEVVVTPRKSELVEETPLNKTPASKWQRLKALYQKGGILLVLICTAIGIGLGLGLSYGEADKTVVSWIEIPGALYLRGLKCLVVPLIFCSMALGVGEISASGNSGASSAGGYSVLIYMLTTALASCEGLIMVFAFRGMFSQIKEEEKAPMKAPYLSLMCENGQYLQSFSNGSLSCSVSNSTYLSVTSARFNVTDVNKVFLNGDKSDTTTVNSISDTLQNLLKTLITDNIVQAMAYPTILSVVTFAIAFGYGISKVRVEVGEKNYILIFVRQLNDLVMGLISIFIDLTPLAIIFLVGGAIANERDLSSLFSNVAVLVLMVFLGLTIHMFFTLPGIFFVITKTNPFPYLMHCIPAISFAFASSSSIGTLPVTMKCVEATKQVSASIARFCLSFGATINMDGAAIYYPAAIVFVAEVSGNGESLDAGAFITLLIASTIGAVGASPIPTPGLVNVLMIWQATFPNIPVPPQIAYLQAIDWLNDRGCTMANIWGDAIVARLVQHFVSKKDKKDSSLDAASHP